MSDSGVPVDELQSLADEWVARYDEDEMLAAWEAGDAHGHGKCAGQLENLIETHTDE